MPLMPETVMVAVAGPAESGRPCGARSASPTDRNSRHGCRGRPDRAAAAPAESRSTPITAVMVLISETALAPPLHGASRILDIGRHSVSA